MLEKSFKTWGSSRVVPPSGVFLGLALAAGSAMGVDRLDPEADKILKSMSTYLGGLSSFSANTDIDSEFIDLEGQKLQLSSSTTMVVERPGNLYIKRQGVLGSAEVIFDGKDLTIYGKNRNAYYQVESPGTIDDVVDAVRENIRMDVPAADLMYADPYAGLASDITSSTYRGSGYVNGVECHHLTFREAKVDWQLWVKAGDEPLPMKYVITTKWITGAPQYSVRFRDWNTKPRIEADQFKFSAPKGAKKLAKISVDVMGEPVMGEIQQ